MKFNYEQTYIVTGASSGIGRATALLLNEQGATVVAIARREEQLKSLLQECKNPENMHYEVKDLTEDMENLPNYIKSLKEKYGKFTGMAYCAGIGGIHTLQTIDTKDYNSIFNLNYLAPVFMTKGIVDKRNNTGNDVSLVYVSSYAGTIPTKGQILYAGSKAALIASMKSISKELASRKIRVNTVSPAWVNTAMYKETLDRYNQNFGSFPLGIIEDFDVANLVSFLLSNDSGKITGVDYIIDGGSSMEPIES